MHVGHDWLGLQQGPHMHVGHVACTALHAVPIRLAPRLVGLHYVVVGAASLRQRLLLLESACALIAIHSESDERDVLVVEGTRPLRGRHDASIVCNRGHQIANIVCDMRLTPEEQHVQLQTACNRV